MDQKMIDPTAFNPAELVPLQADLLEKPLKDIGFENLARQQRT